jgi:hypothetical protein
MITEYSDIYFITKIFLSFKKHFKNDTFQKKSLLFWWNKLNFHVRNRFERTNDQTYVPNNLFMEIAVISNSNMKTNAKKTGALLTNTNSPVEKWLIIDRYFPL